MAEESNSTDAALDAPKNHVRLVEDENSYINSSKERMNDVIEAFINNAENSMP